MSASNFKLSDYYSVAKSKIHGQGLFAKVDLEQDEYLGTYAGRKAKNNAMHVLWVEQDDGSWIGRHGQNILRYLNHSKKPCCEFDGFDLYALRDIKAGEELTFDYGEDPA